MSFHGKLDRCFHVDPMIADMSSQGHRFQMSNVCFSKSLVRWGWNLIGVKVLYTNGVKANGVNDQMSILVIGMKLYRCIHVEHGSKLCKGQCHWGQSSNVGISWAIRRISALLRTWVYVAPEFPTTKFSLGFPKWISSSKEMIAALCNGSESNMPTHHNLSIAFINDNTSTGTID